MGTLLKGGSGHVVSAVFAASAAALLLGSAAQAQDPPLTRLAGLGVPSRIAANEAGVPVVDPMQQRLFGVPSRPLEDVAVIVNKSNPIDTLSMIQLRKIVLAEDGKWPSGGAIIVWMTSPGQAERAATLKIVCGMSETDFTLHFTHASFNSDSGSPPKVAGSGALVRQSIAGAANGVGFIWASQVDDSVKVVPIEGIRPGQRGYKLKPK